MKHTQKFSQGSSNTLVVFVHGFCGSPIQFDDLADAVHHAGCSVLSLLLPGHGGNASSFSRAGMDDWQSYVDSELRKAIPRYRRIILVGHSMGGLLALNSSITFSDYISGVIMLSSPLKLYLFNPLSHFRRLGIFLRPKLIKLYFGIKSVSGLPLGIKPYLELLRLMKTTRSNLPHTNVPIVAVHSRRDELTAYRSASMFAEGIPQALLEQITLKQALHNYYPPEERAMICAALLRMVSEV